MTIAAAQASLLFFFLPLLSAASISMEKEKRTYDLLRTTLLSSQEIVTGKLFVTLTWVLLLFFLTLPLFSLCFLLGGITPGVILEFSCCLFAVSLLLNSFGIYLSTCFERVGLTVGLMYAGILPLSIFTYTTLTGLLKEISSSSFFEGIVKVPFMSFQISLWFLVVAEVAWLVPFFLEKAAQNIELVPSRNPKNIQWLFLVGYFINLALILGLFTPQMEFGVIVLFIPCIVVFHLYLLLFYPVDFKNLRFFSNYYAPFLFFVSYFSTIPFVAVISEKTVINPIFFVLGPLIMLDYCLLSLLLSRLCPKKWHYQTAMGVILGFTTILLTLVNKAYCSNDYLASYMGFLIPYVSVALAIDNNYNLLVIHALWAHGILFLVLLLLNLFFKLRSQET
ncbi:MAG: hypothetical protein V2A78_11560 [bacterium]